MTQKLELEKQRIASQENRESVLSSPQEQYQKIIESNEFEISDPIVNAMVKSINEKFDNLTSENKEKVLRYLQDFFIAIREYKDSYDSLKYAARKERGVFYEGNVRGWQESVKSADRREKILHDKFLDSANILARIMKSVVLYNKWRGYDLIYHLSGANDSTDEIARDKIRQWMLRVYHEEFNSENAPTSL